MEGALYKAEIRRSGDLTKKSTVRCFTRQGTARVTEDFIELPNNTDSTITFEPKQHKAYCEVLINPDKKWEQTKESFKLKLDNPTTELEGVEAKLGLPDELLLNIHDISDKPKIQFRREAYQVFRPIDDAIDKYITVNIDRIGDSSQTSKVRLYTVDALAKAGDGEDYLPVSKDIVFEAGQTEKSVKIQILHRNKKEIKKSFWVKLLQDEYEFADVSDMERTKIDIEDQNPSMATVFPLPPVVISLKDYGKGQAEIGEITKEDIRAGYPVRFGLCKWRFFLSQKLCKKNNYGLCNF